MQWSLDLIIKSLVLPKDGALAKIEGSQTGAGLQRSWLVLLQRFVVLCRLKVLVVKVLDSLVVDETVHGLVTSLVVCLKENNYIKLLYLQTQSGSVFISHSEQTPVQGHLTVKRVIERDNATVKGKRAKQGNRSVPCSCWPWTESSTAWWRAWKGSREPPCWKPRLHTAVRTGRPEIILIITTFFNALSKYVNNLDKDCRLYL